MATNTSQDVGRSGLGYIAFRTGRVNLKTRHMLLRSSMSTPNPQARIFSSCLLPVPSKAAPGRILRSGFPARISSQSSHHCWKSPLPHASASIEGHFGCVLEVQHTKQLPKLIWCGSWGKLGQSLSNHGPNVLYQRKIRRVSRPGKQFNLVIDEGPLHNACHVWSCFILLKYGCGQTLKVRKDNCLQHLGDVTMGV
ncbi:uncharacterized protein TNCV_3017971 [Trichonephila clavipes]|nr:uncharacterized protein TNCV_3017971 [Trichonephila clavipes]